MSVLRQLDAFPKIQDDFYSKTLSGGLITIACSIAMACLFVTELVLFLSTQTLHKLEVDMSRGERISIHIDITFPRMPCEWLSVDAIDATGRVQTSIDHDLYRQRLSTRGIAIETIQRHAVNAGGESGAELPPHLRPEAPGLPSDYCGSCYGAETETKQCCNTCDAVRTAYRTRGWVMPEYDSVEQCKREGFQDSILSVKNEGCHLWGDLEVAKIAGNIQIAPGKTYIHLGQLVHDLQPLRAMKLDISHRITGLSFGDPYPGQTNPLSGTSFEQNTKTPENPEQLPGMYQYFLKVVPTTYTPLRGRKTVSNQYSVTDHYRPMDPKLIVAAGVPPGVFFYYDLSAIKVNVEEHKASFLHFITNVCAIVGGVFTISGILDATVYHSQRLIRKKIELGKMG